MSISYLIKYFNLIFNQDKSELCLKYQISYGSKLEVAFTFRSRVNQTSQNIK